MNVASEMDSREKESLEQINMEGDHPSWIHNTCPFASLPGWSPPVPHCAHPDTQIDLHGWSRHHCLPIYGSLPYFQIKTKGLLPYKWHPVLYAPLPCAPLFANKTDVNVSNAVSLRLNGVINSTTLRLIFFFPFCFCHCFLVWGCLSLV